MGNQNTFCNPSSSVIFISITIVQHGSKIWKSNQRHPDSKVHGANMGPTWVLSAPDGPHVGPRNLAFRVFINVTMPRLIGHIMQATVSYIMSAADFTESVYCLLLLHGWSDRSQINSNLWFRNKT